MNSVKITKDTEKLTQFDTILSNGVQAHIFVCYTKCQNISQINYCLILKFSLESLVTLLNRLLKGFGKLTEPFMYRTIHIGTCHVTYIRKSERFFALLVIDS